ncbi:MAG: DsbA family protein, partial [Nanoarchaeota archaeon]
KVQQYANIVTGGAVVEVGVVLEDEDSGLYRVPLTVRGQTMNGYVTKDGNLFFPAAVNLADFFDQVNSLGDQGAQEANNEPAQTAPVDVSVDDDPILGKEDAPVTIVEFSDYQCPFCGRFEKDTFPTLKEEYIDTGKVKLIFRDFPLTSIHPYAQKAAEASECADEQGKFWKYHDKLFENQEALTVDDLKKYADDLNLNNNKFENCLDSDSMKEEVKKDTDDGINYGVTGTPAFFINGIILEGAQPFENFKQIIDEELAKVENKDVGTENETK